jgi:dihydrodipicolinate reductase
MKLLIVGYGKMGRLIDQLASESGFEVVGRVDDGRDEWAPADAAIDFSTADALLANFQRYVELQVPLVIGTTGWNAHDDALRARAAAARLGVVAAANFSIGVNVFQLVAEQAARLMRVQEQYGAWIHEAHHATKRDAPSGTAILLRDALVQAGFNRPSTCRRRGPARFPARTRSALIQRPIPSSSLTPRAIVVDSPPARCLPPAGFRDGRGGFRCRMY